jgi:hypothetical protein
LKFHRDLTLLSLFKKIIIKTILNFLLFHEELFWEKESLQILFWFYSKPMPTFCKGIFPKMIYCLKGVVLQKGCFENDFQMSFYKSIFSDF